MTPPARTASVQTPFGEGLIAWTPHGVIALEAFVSAQALPQSAATIRFEERVAELTGAPPQPAPLTATLQRRLARSFDGHTARAPVDLSVFGPLQRDVYASVMSIRRGTVWSYADVARDIGRPRAWRAVGSCLRACPIDLLIPCHRVVHAGGKIGGWGSGSIEWKRRLLEREGLHLP